MSAKNVPADIDEYIAAYGPEQQTILQLVRAAIHRGVPNGQEKIRYDMAGFGRISLVGPGSVRPDRTDFGRDRQPASGLRRIRIEPDHDRVSSRPRRR